VSRSAAATETGTAYVAMPTALYVDNGPRLALGDHLPTIAFWLLPSAIGAPIIAVR
jgi:hypothetical protein